MTQKDYYIYGKQQLSKYYEVREAEALCLRLLEDKYGIKKEDLIIGSDKKMNPGRGFFLAIDKLCRYIPIQHITGFQEFMGYRFQVSKSTLIPRPETEELVSLIVDHNSNKSQNQGKGKISILDIGTGTGAIATSLALLLPNPCKGSTVIGVDISKRALKIARENARRLNADVAFAYCDFLDRRKSEICIDTMQWDIIVSNPPYIPERDKAIIPSNVLRHDPDLALFVSDDNPLVFYTEISRYAYSHLRPGGRLYFEINENFGSETMKEVSNAGFSEIHLLKDMSGKDRIIWSQK